MTELCPPDAQLRVVRWGEQWSKGFSGFSLLTMVGLTASSPLRPSTLAAPRSTCHPRPPFSRDTHVHRPWLERRPSRLHGAGLAAGEAVTRTLVLQVSL